MWFSHLVRVRFPFKTVINSFNITTRGKASPNNRAISKEIAGEEVILGAVDRVAMEEISSKDRLIKVWLSQTRIIGGHRLSNIMLRIRANHNRDP